MTVCSWERSCREQGRHLVWRRGGLGDVETEVTCGQHLRDATGRGYRNGAVPGMGTERFELSAADLRVVVDWVAPADRIVIDLPTEVADVVRLWQEPL